MTFQNIASHLMCVNFSEQKRRLKANSREYNDQFHYVNNRIQTYKYNVLTFLPINLFEQFQRAANAYFLSLLILQLIPDVSALSWFTTIVPLVLVLSVTAVKNATDDYFCHRRDKQVNSRQARVLIGGKLQNEKWKNVRAGDIIKLENNQFVVADLLLLSSSEPHGLCYIETAELDGETNLKVRQALPATSELGDEISKLARFDGEVVCEAPNHKLNQFSGTLSWNEENHPLTNEEVLLRGCVLRNTDWCFGMVIFAGPDTKLMQNSGKTRLKRTSIDQLMNSLVLWIFGLLIFMGIILAIGNSIWEHQVGVHFRIYLQWNNVANSSVFSGFLTFWSYVIILNSVVPISLYVSVEVIRLGHSYFINWDHKMYFAKEDVPAEVRTTTLSEGLGQIEYIFSDKTGTLTQNIMTFHKCSINGHIFGKHKGFRKHNLQQMPVDFSFSPLVDSKFSFDDHRLFESVRFGDPQVHEFFRLLSLCHTVMPEEKPTGELIYQAQSPDEGALVTAARNFGFVFKSRTPETITVEEMGALVTYQLLAILDFNNTRKRMSVIVQNPRGQITLYSKGADTILFERLHPSSKDLMFLTSDHLAEFAGEGLRTLALAYKNVSEEEFQEWFKIYEEANASPDRDEDLALAYEEIERDLKLLGATAIEDKLQEGVVETIASLLLANIKIWVLTGDKQETAINIGYSSRMLTDAMDAIFIVESHTKKDVSAELRKAKDHMFVLNSRRSADENLQDLRQGMEEVVIGDYALIINGHSLVHALEVDLVNEFLEVACACKTVICCRVTPLQKAQVVDLVKKRKKAITLAVGDGSNDIGMIKNAHIGVGISGQEGRQAVLNSDYSIAQFRYLQRLLLIHGRWSYFRMCKFLCYFFYKNFAFTLVHFLFGFFCGFSAQAVYDQWFITLFNIVYTSLPVLAMGLFDQDVNEQECLDFPKLYQPGQRNLLFNKRKFFICIAHGIYTSIVLFFIPYGVFYDAAGDDGKHVADHQSFAVTVATSLIIVVSLQIALDTSYWTGINHFFIWGSIAVYFAVLFVMQSNGIFDLFPGHFPFVGNAWSSLGQLNVWLAIFLTTVVSVMPVIAFRFVKLDLWPTLSNQVRLLRRAKKKQRPLQRYMQQMRRSSSRRSAYAFAHQEGFGELITSGKNMRISLDSTQKVLPNRWMENLRNRPSDTTSNFSCEKPVL
uniref:probable phospholipid-transporting ATPase IM n=1 Tax=Euleptes europaea TaxID=460621 RepID=UPI0025401C6A|nr:probable phospholipid-transporting ATPase IM [Euleptes europaea]